MLATLDLPANFDMGHLMNKTGDTIKNAAFRFEGDYMFKFMPGVVGSGFARGALYCNRNGAEDTLLPNATEELAPAFAL